MAARVGMREGGGGEGGGVRYCMLGRGKNPDMPNACQFGMFESCQVEGGWKVPQRLDRADSF
jgi:hypothetical protein